MGLAKTKTYYYSLEEYLETERKADERSEFIDGEIYAMADESGRHGDISMNLAGIIQTRLRGTDCRES